MNHLHGLFSALAVRVRVRLFGHVKMYRVTETTVQKGPPVSIEWKLNKEIGMAEATYYVRLPLAWRNCGQEGPNSLL
jgi:hypothetical protein